MHQGRRIVAINFGVGEKPAKRIGDGFEKHLVSRLIFDGGAVILDRGVGEEETRRADAVIRDVSDSMLGAHVVESDEESLQNPFGFNRLA